MSRSDRVSQTIESSSASGAPTWLPDAARRVVLVSGSSGSGLGGSAAVEVAEMVARHRPRTLFVNTVAGAAGPDGSLEVEDRPGLGDVLVGRRRVSEVALTPQGRSFIFVPAGRSQPGMGDFCRLPAFRHMVAAAGRGGTLLLHIEENDLPRLFARAEEGSGLEFDGIVVLGKIAVPPDVQAQVGFLARVEREAVAHPPSSETVARPAGSAGFSRPSGTPVIVGGARGGLSGRLDRLVADVRQRAGAGGAEDSTASGRKPRGHFRRLIEDVRKRGLPRGVWGVAIVWIVAVLVVWLVWQGLSGWPAFEDDFVPPVESPMTDRSPAGSGGDEVAEAGEGSPAADGGATPPVIDAPVEDLRTSPDPGVAAGVVLPYSVLVASYVTYEDAAARRDELKEQGGLVFVAPTPIRGRLYYRVFAGAVEDRVQADDLMARLVEQGSKERERDWDMRPVRLAFALQDLSSEEEAEAEVERLHGSGVPAYVLAVGDTTGAVYRLYSGAFESEAAAAPADSLISATGQEATLVTRRGEPR